MGDLTTWNYLKSLGFRERQDPVSSTQQLYYDFGNFILAASQSLNRYFQEMVIFGGDYLTERMIGLIEFEIPPNLVSVEQTAAMIYYYLRNHEPAVRPDWFERAKSDSSLLPWEIEWRQERERKAALPQCEVERDWLRPALRQMREIIASATEADCFGLEFDGTVLKINCGDIIVPLAAKGNPWSKRYELPLDGKISLPQRLTNGRIHIDNEVIWISDRPVGRVREIPIVRWTKQIQ